MPKPKKGEKRGEYIQRAVQTIMGEDPKKSLKQALGKAYGMFEGEKKGEKK